MFAQKGLSLSLATVLGLVYGTFPSSAQADGSSACPLGPGQESHRVVNNSGSFWAYQAFQSSAFNPPEFKIQYNGQALTPGLLFLTPSNFQAVPATKDVAPLIMTDRGQLVWNGPQINATNFHVQSFQSKPVITYWSGLSTDGANVGHGYGNITFLDTSYQEVLTVCPKLGLTTSTGQSYPCEADFHESHVTTRSTLIFTAYNATRADLSSLGGPRNGWVYDSLVYEVEPRSGRVLFRWSALEHVPVNASRLPLNNAGTRASPFDYFHVNSAVEVGDSYLINSRHVWSTYLVNQSGAIQWHINGETGGDFGPLPPGGTFRWQHDPRPHNVTSNSLILTIFNNNNAAGVDMGQRPTNGLTYQLSLPPSRSRSPVLLSRLLDPSGSPSVYVGSQGSHAIFENGHSLMGYGQIPIAREYGPGSGNNTNVRWQARFGADNLTQNYRTFKQAWSATPARTAPSLAVPRTAGQSGCRPAYVSWNGATDIQSWRVYQGAAANALRLTGSVPFRGFETSFNASGPYLQVGAVIANGTEYRSSIVQVS